MQAHLALAAGSCTANGAPFPQPHCPHMVYCDSGVPWMLPHIASCCRCQRHVPSLSPISVQYLGSPYLARVDLLTGEGVVVSPHVGDCVACPLQSLVVVCLRRLTESLKVVSAAQVWVKRNVAPSPSELARAFPRPWLPLVRNLQLRQRQSLAWTTATNHHL